MGYITLAFLGIPNKGEQNQRWLPHPCLLGGPKEGEKATSPLHSRGSPTPSARSKIRRGPQQKGTKSEVVATSLPCQRLKKRVDGLHHPCILGDPQQKGTESEVAASSMPSRGPKRGQKCYVTPVFSGVPNAKRGEQHQKWSPTKGEHNKWLPHPCLVRGQKRGWMGYITLAFLGIPNKGKHNQKWLPHPCLV